MDVGTNEVIDEDEDAKYVKRSTLLKRMAQRIFPESFTPGLPITASKSDPLHAMSRSYTRQVDRERGERRKEAQTSKSDRRQNLVTSLRRRRQSDYNDIVILPDSIKSKQCLTHQSVVVFIVESLLKNKKEIRTDAHSFNYQMSF